MNTYTYTYMYMRITAGYENQAVNLKEKKQGYSGCFWLEEWEGENDLFKI